MTHQRDHTAAALGANSHSSCPGVLVEPSPLQDSPGHRGGLLSMAGHSNQLLSLQAWAWRKAKGRACVSVCERERVATAHEGSKTLHSCAHAGWSIVLVQATDGGLTTSRVGGIPSGFHVQKSWFRVICASSQERTSLFLTPLLYLFSTGPTTVMVTRAVPLWAIQYWPLAAATCHFLEKNNFQN